MICTGAKTPHLESDGVGGGWNKDQPLISYWSAGDGTGPPDVSDQLFYRVMYLSLSTWTKLRLSDAFDDVLLWWCRLFVLCLWSETSWMQWRLSLCPPVCPVSVFILILETLPRSGWMFYALTLMFGAYTELAPHEEMYMSNMLFMHVALVTVKSLQYWTKTTSYSVTKPLWDRPDHGWVLKANLDSLQIWYWGFFFLLWWQL